MQADGGENVGVGVGQGQGSPTGFKCRSNRNQARNTRLGGTTDNLNAVGVEIGKVKVAVGIDQHNGSNVTQGKWKKESFIGRTIPFPPQMDEGKNLP